MIGLDIRAGGLQPCVIKTVFVEFGQCELWRVCRRKSGIGLEICNSAARQFAYAALSFAGAVNDQPNIEYMLANVSLTDRQSRVSVLVQDIRQSKRCCGCTIANQQLSAIEKLRDVECDGAR